MLVKSYQPKHPILQKHIECIYTLRRDEGEESTKYVAFPGIYAMACLNTNTRIEATDSKLLFAHSPQYPMQSSLICEYVTSSVVEYDGPTDEVVIYFKPLGISAFLEKPLRHYFSFHCTPFNPFEDYIDVMNSVFNLAGDEARLEAIEAYWLTKYRGFEHPFLHEIIEEMIADAGAFSIADAVKRHGITRTTLSKHFDMHIGTTPSQFRKILRFREAMKRHHRSIDAENLTHISHGAEYFDQSHMVKDFKALTRYSPKAFFARLSVIEGGNINWVFLPPT
jgi:AraC-like DNA-binding protein